MAKAQAHLARGRYEEAIEVFERARSAKLDPVAIALGESDAQQAIGAWEAAEKTIDAARAQSVPQSRLTARRAELAFLRGRHTEAQKFAKAVLELRQSDDLGGAQARLVLADVAAATGRFAEANEGYRWFIHFYNDRQPTDAATLLVVARGALQYALWNHSRQIFQFVVNSLCPDAVSSDPNAWEAHFLAGSLLLEKFNRQQAIPELEQALAINPQAAGVLVALGRDALGQNDLEKADDKARQALEINPALPAALRLRCDLCLASGRIGEAEHAAEGALAINPRDERSLARLAACRLVRNGPHDSAEFDRWLVSTSPIAAPALDHGPAADPRFAKLWAKLCSWNPRPAVFLTDLGRLVESRRRLDLAEICYRRAKALAPQLPEAKASLAMLLLRVGKLDEARPALDEAFRADPYHAQISNFRKVLKLLDGYEAISTEHFVIRVDSQLDKLLGACMAEYLEEIYPELVAKFGFAPPHRTQFEIFNRADGISGHEWFSARMIGFPWIRTIGASTGEMVAMASPTSSDKPFNWARVLRHEFVHVITVQQTRFNIPQWFTEALAVLNEGYPPPASWNALLADRLASEELRTLDTLDRGFQRPTNSDDWQLAYCQSRLYAEYMIERGGPDSLNKMLAAYRDRATTQQAIQKVFGVQQSEFERGYREFLREKVAAFQQIPAQAAPNIEQLEAGHRRNPDDSVIARQYAAALEQFCRRDPDNPAPRKRLTELALHQHRYQDAIRFGKSALYVDVLDAEIHRELGTAYLALGDVKRALAELDAAMQLAPKDNEVELIFAKALIAAGRPAEAKTRLRAILARDAKNQDARISLEQLK